MRAFRSIFFFVSGVIPAVMAACSSTGGPGGGSPLTPTNNDAGGTAVDAGQLPQPDAAPPDARADAKPPAKAPADGGKTTGRPPDAGATFPDAGYRGGPLDAAALADASPPETGEASPLDPADEANMPSAGLSIGSCTNVGLTEGAGRCWNDPATGVDLIEGCAQGNAYVLDCSGYDTADEVRSVCVDDGTVAGCAVVSVGRVAQAQVDDVTHAEAAGHACPPQWDGYGFCNGNYITMCVNGQDYYLDCSIYDTGETSYTCGKDSSNNVGCL